MYRVTNWDKHFENNRSRAITDLRWVPMPNHHDSASYCALLSYKNGVAFYGCWALIVQVASTCHPRGTLASGGRQLTAATLAAMVRVDTETMGKAIAALLQIGWLEDVVDETSVGRQSGVRSASVGRQEGVIEGIEGNRREGNRKEGKGKEGNPCASDFELHGNKGTKQAQAIYDAYPRHVGKSAALREIDKALQHEPFERLLAKVEEFAASPAGNAEQYTPHPATWFNAGRWNDDPAEWQRRREDGGRPIGTTIARLDAARLSRGPQPEPKEGETF